MANEGRIMAVWAMPASGISDRRHDFPRQPYAFDHMVSSNVVCVTTQKNGVSALGLQRVLGLGSYKTAWALLHKLRRAMVRPGRDRLHGLVEVDETYWGGEEKGVAGRLTEDKALIIVAAEADGKGIGRIRLRRVPDLTKETLHGFIAQAVEPGNTVQTDGLNAYIPGNKRKDVIQQFKEDDRCRAFLSTDAGGVGLNLQNASAVINMDIPWNPAVLDQRIGRVHRLGQHRPVRVVNFVSQGTIEHGMLSLLSFKKSLFAGILEDGQDEVFLGGTRLKRFMDSVEKTTSAVPAAMLASSTDNETEVSRHRQTSEPSQPQNTDAAQQIWNNLISELLISVLLPLQLLQNGYTRAGSLFQLGL